MKKTLLITTMLFVNQLFSQSEIEIALNFQNTLRSYYYLSELELDNELSILSNQLADKLLMSDSLFTEVDDYADNLFSIDNFNLPLGYNPYLDASLAWTIDSDDPICLENIIDEDYEKVGFGMAKSKNKIIVVVKYK